MTNHDNWFGYLVAALVSETVTQSMECCQACVDKKNSPLLHAHHQTGLLEKLTMFHNIVRDLLLSKLSALVSDYVTKFPDAELYDEAGQRVLKAFGRDFLLQSHPRGIYYSKHLTPAIDEIVTETPTLRIKTMNFKRVANKVITNSKKKQKTVKKEPIS